MNYLTKYVRHIRRQSKHMQHMHAFIFAGIITAIVAGIILYTDYGFWHETYIGESAPAVTQETAAPPGEVFSNFWSEARSQFSNIGSSTASLIEGKETYQSTGTTSVNGQ
ncbi:MAG: hypothetical protein JWN37_311 [Candidatus Nomurabacteria bacterium]|nr:hypothetical protein [Candidatus Nomurabacteria bacterium]